MDTKGKHFILCHEKAITDGVDLKELVPKLYYNGLLTGDNREELLYVHNPPNQRKTKLVTILSNKGNDAPRLLIRSLREEKTHPPHAELAALLEHDLQASQRQDGGGSAGHLTQGVLPTDTNGANTPPVLPGPSHSLPNYIHPSSSHGICGHTSTAHASNQCLTSDAQYHLAPPSTHRAPITSGSCSQCPSSCGPPVVVSLKQLQKYSPNYANLILNLSANISQRGFTFEDISTALRTLLKNNGISFELPSNVNDFPTLCLHLRKLNMCHEADVDLLCELLRTMQLEDLKQLVKDYADTMSSVDVMQHRFQQTSLTEHHFLTFTFHNIHALTVGDACEIKHQISELLHIPRHTFSVVRSEPGSIGLAWQIPTQYFKHVKLSLEEDEHLRASLASSKYCFESIKLLVKEGSERIVVFSKSTSKTSRDETKLREKSPESRSSQEDVISSTMDDVSPTDSQSRKSLKHV